MEHAISSVGPDDQTFSNDLALNSKSIPELDVLTGAIPPLGSRPFVVPRSTDAVQASQSDGADDSEDPLFEHGAGLRYE